MFQRPALHQRSPDELARLQQASIRQARWAGAVLRQTYWNQGQLYASEAADPGAASLVPGEQSPLARPRLRDRFLGEEAPPYRMNPSSASYSLWEVAHGSEEWQTVSAIAGEGVAGILRVQNPTLFDGFCDSLRDDPPGDALGALRAGFHSLKTHDVWPDILRSGLRPDLSRPYSDMYGLGAYLARTRATAERYGRLFFFPDDMAERPSGAHRFTCLFCCNAGHTAQYNAHSFNPFVPDGCGSLGDRASSPATGDVPDVFCIQDWRRAYPAYMLIGRLS